MTITSTQEQEIAENLLRTRSVKNCYWLGGYRSGNTWSWVTGENFLYTHWASYQPDNFLGNEDALMIYNGVNPMNPLNKIGEWNDVKSDGNCNNEPFFGFQNFGFICEWDTNVAIARESYRYMNSKSIIDGIYSLQPQCAPDKELSVENNSTNWGANVIIDSINSNWKKWKVQRIANTDYYSIIAVHSNLALDVANARAENGVNISTWPYLGGSQNQFKILDAGNGYYVIQANIGGNFVVDVFNRESNAGTNVWSYGFNGTPAQLWKFVPIQSLPVFQPYSKRATQKVTAYVMPDLQARSGDEYVSAGDNVTVLREEGDAIFVRYPVRGGTKERWVNKNDIFSNNNYQRNNLTLYADYPSSIYLTQIGKSTCTLVSSAMMLRAKAYLNGDSNWSSITENSLKSTAWINREGLRHEFTYRNMHVSHVPVSGISVSSLKNLLNLHPEGVVIHCSSLPHAVWVFSYSGDTFYCSDPLGNYSGDKRSLSNSYLGIKFGKQSNILNNVTAYWYIK